MLRIGFCHVKWCTGELVLFCVAHNCCTTPVQLSDGYTDACMASHSLVVGGYSVFRRFYRHYTLSTFALVSLVPPCWI